MSGAKFTVQRRVYVGAVLAVSALAGFWFWSGRFESGAGESAGGVPPFVRVSAPGQGAGDDVLRERADLFDPAPLFVPTARNFSQGPLPARLVKQPGQVFGDFGPKLSLGEGGLATFGVENIAAGETLAEVLARSNEVPFAGLGEIAAPRRALENRSAMMSIKKLDGSNLRQLPVENLTVPQADFSPVEFLVAVGPAGLIGDPILAVGSGREEIDGLFQDFVAKTIRVGTVLAPGRYRVVIGP
jgi:hypothetical protein